MAVKLMFVDDVDYSVDHMRVTHMQVDAVYRSGAKASTNHQFKTLCTDEPEPEATTEIIETTTTTVIEDPLAMCDTSQKLELEDFMVDMKVKSYGQEPEATEGLALVSWTHSMACISTYSIHLCLAGEESCWKGSLEGSQLDATLKQDLGALVLPNRLQQCSSYTLTILPSDKVTKKTFYILSTSIHIPTTQLRIGEQESPLAEGFSQEFTYIPGLSPPQVGC